MWQQLISFLGEATLMIVSQSKNYLSIAKISPTELKVVPTHFSISFQALIIRFAREMHCPYDQKNFTFYFTGIFS